MILILSTIQDQSTYDVINWLEYKNADYILFNEKNKIQHIEIYINTNQNNIKIRTEKGHDIDFSKLTAFWHRKGNFAFKKNVTDFNSNFTTDIKQEWDRINEYLFFYCYDYLHSSKPYYQDNTKAKTLIFVVG